MDHLVLPLDVSHVHVVDELIAGVAAAAGLTPPPEASDPHLTLIAHRGLDSASVASAIAAVAAATAPFTIHAHGYGFFTGPEPSDLSLHVPVVRSAPLEALHGGLCAAVRDAGADIAGWSAPEVWSPHITLLDRQLDPARLGAAAAWLAQRRHPSWRISIDRVAVTGGWAQRHRPALVLPLGCGAGPILDGTGRHPIDDRRA